MEEKLSGTHISVGFNDVVSLQAKAIGWFVYLLVGCRSLPCGLGLDICEASWLKIRKVFKLDNLKNMMKE